MLTMHPTLLIGPADWNAERMPRVEFEARIEALFTADPEAGGIVVFGSSLDHAALAYLTHFTPKLEAALALIPRRGAAQLLVGGGVNMIAAARPLTWIDDLVPLRNAGKTVADWARKLSAGSRILLIGGDSMPCALHQGIGPGLTDRAVADGTGLLQSQMLRKAPRELAALRQACAGLAAAAAALRRAQEAGAGVTAAVLAAEHAALQAGAQDVRSLFSLDAGRTLQPFDVSIDEPVAPLQAYLAVRHAGYWAEGFLHLARAGDPLHAQAREMLRIMIAAAQPGATSGELAGIAASGRGEWHAHPLADPVFGNAVGLALQEPPLLSGAGDVRLAAGAVYSLRAGVCDRRAGSIVSAMLHVREEGNEVLWSEDAQA